jgi:hypothetical protein
MAVTIRANLTSTHQVKTRTPDGRDLFFLTGTGIADFAGTTSDFIRDSLAIHLSPPDGPVWSTIDECAPVVALAALWNGGTAVNAGWAVDWTDWTTYAWPGQGPHLLVTSGLAVSDTDGILIRVSYQATVLGRLG